MLLTEKFLRIHKLEVPIRENNQILNQALTPRKLFTNSLLETFLKLLKVYKNE